MAKLIMTVEEMKDRQAWLKLRNSGLGGSDASVSWERIPGKVPWLCGRKRPASCRRRICQRICAFTGAKRMRPILPTGLRK